MRIGSKIILSFLAVISLSSFLVGLMSFRAVRSQILADTRAELDRAGKDVVTLLESAPSLNWGDFPQLKTSIRLRTMFQTLDGLVAVTDAQGNVLISNRPSLFQDRVLDIPGLRGPGRMVSIHGKHYLAAGYPYERLGRKGMVVVLAEAADVRAVTRAFFFSQMRGYALIMLITALVAALLANSLTRPIRLLKEHADRIKPQGGSIIKLNSPDEIGSLAETINDLSRRLAERHELQERLLQNVSHELKTPLTAVQGYAEAIRDGILEGEDINRALDAISAECQRTKKLVNDIILLSRLETQTDTLRFQDCDLTQVADNALGSIRGLAVTNKIKLSFVHPESPIIVSGDEDNLTRVLINLLANAVRHANARVELSIMPHSANVEIRVTDDGPGFATADLANIFRRFYKGARGETGLGLAISRAVIDRHQGTIAVSNASGGGAQIVITLPAKMHT